MKVPWPEGVVVRYHEPLSRHTALRTGGPCDAFVVVHAPEALAESLALCRERGWAWTLLGAGTRTVVRDGGLAGAAIRLGQGFSTLVRDGLCWDVGAALPVGALVAVVAAAGHAGLEDLSGTPGCLGAALALDDGPGRGWAGVLETVRYLRRGRMVEGTLPEALVGRRPVVLGARFRLAEGDPEVIQAQVRKRLAASRAWSWYEPPVRAQVRAAIQHSSLAGVRLRHVLIPVAAPETLVNLGGGTAADLALLERSVLDRVKRQRGIDLKPRVRWAGRHRPEGNDG
ncbi:MAG: FAD-binding protein [Deltaproteobacteria bacterium]|nr:FAD-binding protein [Deltaproteobacteria bacterium]